jgi:hypothetical protein
MVIFMALTKEMYLDLLQIYGSNDFENVEFIVTTNSDIMRMSWYKREGSGVRWVDNDMGAGVFRSGFEFYHPIPHSIEKGLDENGTKAITFIEVEMIDRIAFKAQVAPSWAWQPPVIP